MTDRRLPLLRLTLRLPRLANASEEAAWQRRQLKALLRQYGLRCVAVEWLDPSTGEPWQDNEEPKEQQS